MPTAACRNSLKRLAFLIVHLIFDFFTAVRVLKYEDFVPQIERPPEGFKYGTIEGSYMADYFKNSENMYFRHIWYHMKDNNVKSLSEGVQAARTGYVISLN